jgi:GNAT superfamily N-acetyltransferase
MEPAANSVPGAFRPASGPSETGLIEQFLLAQGWAGLAAGDHLQKLASEGVRPEEVLWWIPGRAADVRAVALLGRGLLGLLVPSGEQRAPARALLEEHRSEVQRILILEDQVDSSGLDEFKLYPRQLAVAGQLNWPSGSLPVARPALAEDAEALFRIYDHVSWMRQDSPDLWREHLVRQRCWVAELDGQVIAAARWTKSFGPMVEVGAVAADPNFRRRGGATSVTLAATAAAMGESRQAMLRFGNPQLASLYYRLGYQPVGRELVFQRGS